jgi:hypothetical protein
MEKEGHLEGPIVIVNFKANESATNAAEDTLLFEAKDKHTSVVTTLMLAINAEAANERANTVTQVALRHLNFEVERLAAEGRARQGTFAVLYMGSKAMFLVFRDPGKGLRPIEAAEVPGASEASGR